MRDQIRDTLLQRILRGIYPAGHRLIELDLADEFQVSQSPVREALRELEAMGAVESIRYRGTRVRSPNATEIAESYALRAILEARSAELACPCPAPMLEELKQALGEMHQAAEERDVPRYIRQAMIFHRRIVEQSGNRLFLHTWDNLQTLAQMHLVAHRLMDTLPIYASAHDAIYDALIQEDGGHAGKLLRQLMELLVTQLSDGDVLP
ncbi:MAG: GntR family transcriptional regulator [Ferrovum sp.]|nr:GntR family transcriptional regulator [Ferrovum sp.]